MRLGGGEPEPWEAFADALLRRWIVAEDVDAVADQELEEARKALHSSVEEPSLLTAVTLMAHLEPLDIEVFALLLAVEADRGRQRVVAALEDDPTSLRPTTALLAALLPPDGHLAVASDSRLVRAALVQVERDGPWAGRSVAVPGPVVWSFTGDRSLDHDLPDRVELLTIGGPPVSVGELLLVCGGDRSTRAQRALERFGGVVLVSPVPETTPQWEAVVRTATLGMMGVVLEVDGDLPPKAARYLARAAHLSWAVSSPVELPLECLPDRTWDEVVVDDPDASDEEWQEALGVPAPPGARLTREQLRLVAGASAGGGMGIGGAIRRLSGGHLDRLTTRVRPRRTWDDLVLPAAQLEQVRELTARYRYRRTVYDTWGFRPVPSAGVVALFAGPSGTGKTLTAEIIAGELGLDLFKLDLSSVVSKYIGETEKNLDGIFTAAATGDAVLFFDEADSLLGKRSAVGDAHDRYANLEVSYLLQRLERHDGLVLMATNLAKNIDEAFMRRIHVAVEFPLPDEPERLAIWSRSFPPACPTEGLDLGALAGRFELTGGMIRNVSTGAAFLAAEAGSPVTMALIGKALRQEMQKLGRLVVEAELNL